MPSKPFDAATKQLLEISPADWVRFFGLPVGAGAEVIEADLSTVTTEADKVVRVQTDPPYLLHVEFQAGHDDIAERTLRYNVLLWYRHKLPVESVVVLLRRAADLPQSAGSLQVLGQNNAPVIDFRYTVVRVWEQEVEAFLQGGLGLLPFAPLAKVTESELPEVIGQMQTRMERDKQTPVQARLMWTATYLLLGLSYKPAFINDLLEGVFQLQESSTYRAILEEGERRGRSEGRTEGRTEGLTIGLLEGEKRLFTRVATPRLGQPSPQAQAALDAVTSLEAIESLAERLFAVETWDELFGL